jgi:FkbM family methyltransferase
MQKSVRIQKFLLLTTMYQQNIEGIKSDVFNFLFISFIISLLEERMYIHNTREIKVYYKMTSKINSQHTRIYVSFVTIYGKLIYSTFAFLVRLTYDQSGKKQKSFCVDKHSRMVTMSKLAEKIFDLLTCVVGKEAKFNYTISIDYEGCNILIRPFIFHDILMVAGLWEPYIRPILDKEIKKTDVVVDVGAYIGIYAIPLAKKVNKVIAFEAHPTTADILEKSIKLNQLDNVEIVKKVVGSSKEKVNFGLSRVPMVSSVFANNNIESIIEMESADLDTLLVTQDTVDWLIIDVEGYEAKVLEGAQETLLKYSPKIIVELYPQNFKYIHEVLANFGYSIRQIYGLYYYAVKNTLT